jgi:hypothetical protein
LTGADLRADLRADRSRPPLHGRLYRALVDGLVLAKRNLIQIPRIPELLVFATIQPVMFVLLFRYVFGGAIDVGARATSTFSWPASSCRPSPSAP